MWRTVETKMLRSARLWLVFIIMNMKNILSHE